MHWFLFLIGILFWPLLSYAQGESEDYYPYADHFERGEIPILQSDTSLFYRAALRREDLYGELTRYAYTEVAYRRRGIGFGEERNRLDNLSISYRHLTLLRQLGLPIASGIVEGDSFSSFSEPRPSSYRLQTSLTDSRYRFGLRYAMHLNLPREWQLGLFLEGRTGRDLYTEGCYTRMLRGALRLEKRWSERLRLSLTATLAPSERGLAAPSTAETFELVGDHYYNPAWGFYRSKVRSARVRREFLPLVATSLEWCFTPSTSLQLALGAELGFLRRSSLGWFDARTPHPDNYRYLPSYFTDPLLSATVADRWRAHDSRYTQIDWDELYLQNRMSSDGARYVEQDEVEGVTDLNGSLLLRTTPARGLTLRYGVGLAYHLSSHYLELRDLLGADYLLDIDYYLMDDDTYASSLQNDLHNPGRRVTEGERFGYYYLFEEQQLFAIFEADYQTHRWHFSFCGEVGWHHLRREGLFEKELFPKEGSYGKSRPLHFAPFRLSAEAAYGLNARTHLRMRLMAEHLMPSADDLFLQPQYNNRVIDRPQMEQHYATDLTLQGASARFEWSVAAFLRMRREAIACGRYYDDLSGLFTDRVTEGIDETVYGLELAARYFPVQQWRLLAAFAFQRACYTDNPRVSLYGDRDNTLLSDRSESHLSSLYLGGVPHLSAYLSGTYYGRSWGVGCDFTYLGLRYAHPDFMRRTVRVALQAADSKESFDLFHAQKKLPDLFRTDLSVWKHFRLGRRTRITLSLRVENLLGDDSTPYDSYESHRIRRIPTADGYTYRPFDNRLTYAPARRYYLSAAVKF